MVSKAMRNGSLKRIYRFYYVKLIKQCDDTDLVLST